MRLPNQLKAWRSRLNESFAQQVSLFALSLTVGVFLLVGTGSYVALSAQIKASIQNDLEAQALAAESLLRRNMMQASEGLEALSKNSFIANGLVDSQGRDGYLRPFLSDFHLSMPGKGEIALTLYDFMGKPLIRIRPDNVIGPSTDDSMVGQVIATGRPQARLFTLRDKSYLRLVEPINFPPTQSIEGALAVFLPLAPLLGETAIAPTEGQVLQLHAAGTVLAQVGASQKDFVRVERVLKLDAPFDTLGLRLSLDSSMGRHQSRLDQLTLFFVVASLLLLPVVGWLAHHGARRLVAPLAKLGAAAEAIATSGAITLPPHIESSNEVGQLAHAFGRMLARLDAAQDALESKVATRTADLLTSEKYLQTIVDAALDAIITMDHQGRVTDWNPQAEQIFGYSRADALGELLETLIIPVPLRQAHRSGFEHFLKTGEGSMLGKRIEVTAMRADGVELPVEMAMVAIRSGEAVFFNAFLRDISQRKRNQLELIAARDEAQQASVAKSAFLSTMSHEIRTPMNGVIGMIDVLQQTSLQGDQEEMVNLIRESAYSLLHIVEDILDFSKIEAGKLEIERVPMSVSDVLHKACDLLGHLAAKNGVELTLFVDPMLPEFVLGDALRLRQVLVNLASNAIKFSSKQRQPGRVSVRAVLAGGAPNQVTVEFRVADNGIGMDEQTRARLFSAFTQADASTTRRFGGTGLGLAISGHLVQLMGGRVAVHSALGQGATFTVRLPFESFEPLEPLSAAPGSADTRPKLSGISCLVLGDAQGLGDDMATYLRHGGAHVKRAPNLAAASQLIATLAPGPWLFVIDAGHGTPPLAELRAACSSRLSQSPHLVAQEHGRHPPAVVPHFLVISRGRRRNGRSQTADSTALDGNLMTRQSFLQAVALATGQPQAGDDLEEVPAQGRIGAATDLPLTPRPHAQALRQSHLILVAEDNETNQKVILHQLGLLGYAADVACNGREALARWQSGDYALLLTDLHMPEMDGYELSRAIRSSEAGTQRMPIVALTANAIKGEAEHCLAAGMNGYLSKPAQLADLKAVLQEWLPLVGTALPALATPAALTQALSLPVDVSVLKALVGDDPAVVDEFLREFRLDARLIAEELRCACEAGRAKAGGAAAHKLKSSSRAVGALALGELCEMMDQAGRSGQVEALMALLPLFQAEMTAVDDYLEALLSSAPNRPLARSATD